jgi:hypothetical protein
VTFVTFLVDTDQGDQMSWKKNHPIFLKVAKQNNAKIRNYLQMAYLGENVINL